MRVIYDVAHNIAKRERYVVEGEREPRDVLVHRKGATRAFPAGNPEIPARYHHVGQPVLIPGSMGTASYVLVGAEGAMRETFGSVCHGAGRMMSRTAAKKGRKRAGSAAGAGGAGHPGEERDARRHPGGDPRSLQGYLTPSLTWCTTPAWPRGWRACAPWASSRADWRNAKRPSRDRQGAVLIPSQPLYYIALIPLPLT